MRIRVANTSLFSRVSWFFFVSFCFVFFWGGAEAMNQMVGGLG